MSASSERSIPDERDLKTYHSLTEVLEVSPGFSCEDSMILEDIQACNTIELYAGPNKISEIQASTEEAITKETFEKLIAEYAYSKKKLIIAQVKSRDKDRSIIVHTFYFAAHALNKLLYKVTSNDELIGRYSSNYTLCVNNPLTNLPIIGEVEYYLITNTEPPYIADFIGTDYNFLHNDKLRKIFEENALKREDNTLPRIDQSITDLSRWLEVDIASIDILSRILETQREQLLDRITVPFSKAVLYGAAVLLALIVYIGAIGVAGLQVIRSRSGMKIEPTVVELLFMGVLPISSMVLDSFTCYLYKAKEDRAIIVSKIISWIFLVILFILTNLLKGETIDLIFSVSLLGYATHYMLSSGCLYFAHSKRKRLI